MGGSKCRRSGPAASASLCTGQEVAAGIMWARGEGGMSVRRRSAESGERLGVRAAAALASEEGREVERGHALCLAFCQRLGRRELNWEDCRCAKCD